MRARPVAGEPPVCHQLLSKNVKAVTAITYLAEEPSDYWRERGTPAKTASNRGGYVMEVAVN